MIFGQGLGPPREDLAVAFLGFFVSALIVSNSSQVQPHSHHLGVVGRQDALERREAADVLDLGLLVALLKGQVHGQRAP